MVRKILIAVLALCLVAAACGGDDEPELSSADVATDGGDTADSEADGDAADGDPSDAGATDDGDEAMTGDSGSAWCEAARSDSDDGALDFNLLAMGPAEIEQTLTSNVVQLERWEDLAPPEIDSQVTTLADAFRRLVGLAEEANWDLAALASNPEVLAAFDDPALEAAADDIDAYATDVCGVDLGVGLDGGTATAPDSSTPSGGGDDLATEFLAAFGLPPDFLTPDQLDCVNAELAVAFPDGVPADLTLDEEAVNVFSAIGDTCTLGLP